MLADPADWSVDPWSGELREGCVWGRGAIDMKSQVAAEIAAVIALSEEGWRPANGELLVVVTADEEAGAAEGAQWLCAEHPDKVRADMIVNEGAGPVLHLSTASASTASASPRRASSASTLTTDGRAGHASIPKIGDNALTKLAPLLAAMDARQPSLELSPEPESFLRAVGIDPDGDLDEVVAELSRQDPLVARPAGASCSA